MNTSICLVCRNNKPLRVGGSLIAPVCQECNDEVLGTSKLGGKILYADKYKSEIFISYINPMTGK
jgi:hypothetical protein